MTREEEIQEVIKDIHKSIDCNGLACWQCIELSIGKGISWADQHPREGLWDTKKVCKFIKESVREYHKSGVFHVDDFINDLRKAMED